MNNRPQPVRNTQKRFPLKALRHRMLNLLVSLKVDGRGSFVADDDAGVADEGSCKRHELSLAKGEVEAFFVDGGIEG
jgi:hypothetical protein